MDTIKVGKAIADLRKRAGYTQRDLAARMGISDKAVSKWERGISMPDIASLGRLAILLGTNVDNLLAGRTINNIGNWQGLLILGRNPLGIGLDTIIYDKPLISYLFSYFMLVGLKEICIVCSEKEKKFIEEDIQLNVEYGVEVTCVTELTEQIRVNLSTSAENTMLIFGSFFLYGVDQTSFFLKAMQNRHRATSLAIPKVTSSVSDSGARFEPGKAAISNKEEKPLNHYEYYRLPIAFLPSEKIPHFSTMHHSRYVMDQFFSENVVHIELLDRGFVEIELNDWNDIREASEFVRIVQDYCGMKIYCPEEIGWRRGLISVEKMRELGEQKCGEYGDYILRLCNKTQ